MEYEKEIKNILLSNDSNAEDQIRELTAKQTILDVLDSNEDLGINIADLGLTIEDIDNVKYMHLINEQPKDEFAKSDIINLYRYVAHTSSGYGSDNIGANSRSFCKKVSKRTNTSLMRYVDILKLNGSNKGFGQGGSNVYSVFQWRGGVNCKHIWVKYLFNKKTNSLIEAPQSEQPKQTDAGDVGNA